MGKLKDDFVKEKAEKIKEDAALEKVIDALDGLPTAQQKEIIKNIARRLGLTASEPSYSPYDR